MDRNLDGIYFRMKRDGKFGNVCFSDLTPDERDEVCCDRSREWLQALAYHLADCLQDIGEEFGIQGGE